MRCYGLLMWLRITTALWSLWTRRWTFAFHKMLVYSWVTERLVASQEGLSSLQLHSYDPYRVQKFLPRECVLVKMNTVTAVPHYFLMIYFNSLLYYRFPSSLRHYATSRKFAGSIPDEVIRLFNRPNPSSRTMALGSTQPQAEMSTRNLPGM
jgi:hypothetical protein